jgi:hypothetical protein
VPVNGVAFFGSPAAGVCTTAAAPPDEAVVLAPTRRVNGTMFLGSPACTSTTPAGWRAVVIAAVT